MAGAQRQYQYRLQRPEDADRCRALPYQHALAAGDPGHQPLAAHNADHAPDAANALGCAWRLFDYLSAGHRFGDVDFDDDNRVRAERYNVTIYDNPLMPAFAWRA